MSKGCLSDAQSLSQVSCNSGNQCNIIKYINIFESRALTSSSRLLGICNHELHLVRCCCLIMAMLLFWLMLANTGQCECPDSSVWLPWPVGVHASSPFRTWKWLAFVPWCPMQTESLSCHYCLLFVFTCNNMWHESLWATLSLASLALTKPAAHSSAKCLHDCLHDCLKAWAWTCRY